jgi:hypothetical protein
MRLGLIGESQVRHERICVVSAPDPISARLGLQFHWREGHSWPSTLPNLNDYPFRIFLPRPDAVRRRKTQSLTKIRDGIFSTIVEAEQDLVRYLADLADGL